MAADSPGGRVNFWRDKISEQFQNLFVNIPIYLAVGMKMFSLLG